MSEQQTLAVYIEDQNRSDSTDDERYKDADWLRKQYVEKQRTTTDIGEGCGVSDSTINYWLRKYGVEVRSISEARLSENASEKLNDKQWLREQYIQKRRDSYDIADELDVSNRTVLNWLENHDIGVRSISESALSDNVSKKLNDERWLHEQYIQKRRSLYDIADELDASYSAVRRWLGEHDVKLRGRSESQLSESVLKKLNNEGWLREQYIEKRRSASDIAGELDASTTTVIRWLEKHDLEVRGVFEACGVRNPDHLDHKVRSGWELEIANFLCEHEVEYEYESIEIAWEDGHIYTPDFITEDYVIEVKGRLYPGGFEAEKAKSATKQLDQREYVVVARDEVGEQLPCDIHISWSNREALIDLFSED